MILKQFIFNDYPRSVPLGKIRAKYYKKGDAKIPKYISNKIDYFYEFDNKGILIDLHTNKPVLKNPKLAGEIKQLHIAGQSIHRLSKSTSGVATQIKIEEYSRIKNYLKEFYLKELPLNDKLITEPITIEFIYITTKEDALTNGQENDLDNYKQFYEKAFLDAIQAKIYDKELKMSIPNIKAIIPDDNMHYVRRIEHEVVIKDYSQLIINIKQYEDR